MKLDWTFEIKGRVYGIRYAVTSIMEEWRREHGIGIFYGKKYKILKWYRDF